MKTRDGFVSNSSSTSFVVETQHYPNVFALASEIIKSRKWVGKGYPCNDKDLLQRVRAAENHGIDPDSPISFPTINEDTYIIRHGDYYIISTSSNYFWEDIVKGIEDIDENPLIKEFLGERWDREMICFDTITDFWFPKLGIFGKAYRVPNKRDSKDLRAGFGFHKRCPNGHYEQIIVKGSGKIICPECKYKDR